MDAELRIAVCEDMEDERDKLLAAIAKSKQPSRVAAFSNGADLLKTFRKGLYQAVFLDIYMPEESGVDTARAIRALDEKVVLIFVTSSPDHTRDGYRLGVLKYIEKPYQEQEVHAALQLVAKLWQNREMLSLITKQGKVDVDLDEIRYVEVSNHTCILHMEEEQINADVNIENLASLLPSPRFVRCHRSYIVNLGYVKSVDRDFIMEDGEVVYIRGKDERKMASLFAQYLAMETRKMADGQ